MRKSLALALVLVFAIAGATFAAPSFSGQMKVTAEANKFGGPFDVTPAIRVDANFAEQGENWSADLRLRSTWNGAGNVNVAVNRYRGIFEGDGFTATIARGFGLGNVDTPFTWIRQASNPSGVDQIRVTTDLGGIAIATQLRSNDPNLYVRAQTDVDAFTIGGAAQIDLGTTDNSNYTGYVTTSFGIVDVRAIAGSFAGETEFALGATVKPIEQLSIEGRYASVETAPGQKRGATTNGFYVGATYTEGVMQAKANFAELDSALNAQFIYRGSEDNMSFSDLFDESANSDWQDEWYTNVAPAFGVFYEAKDSADAKIRVNAFFPASETAAARARFVTQSGNNEFGVDGWVKVSEKVTFMPYFSKDMADVNTFGADLIYAVGADADITLTAEKAGDEETLKAVYTINF